MGKAFGINRYKKILYRNDSEIRYSQRRLKLQAMSGFSLKTRFFEMRFCKHKNSQKLQLTYETSHIIFF